jgi:hypothetical protein
MYHKPNRKTWNYRAPKTGRRKILAKLGLAEAFNTNETNDKKHKQQRKPKLQKLSKLQKLRSLRHS